MTTKKKTLPDKAADTAALKVLAQQINEGQKALVVKLRGGLTDAMDLGDKLHKAKELAGHGNWEKWFAANCKHIKSRTAQAYMQAASNRVELTAKMKSKEGLTLEDGLRLLAVPKMVSAPAQSGARVFAPLTPRNKAKLEQVGAAFLLPPPPKPQAPAHLDAETDDAERQAPPPPKDERKKKAPPPPDDDAVKQAEAEQARANHKLNLTRTAYVESTAYLSDDDLKDALKHLVDYLADIRGYSRPDFFFPYGGVDDGADETSDQTPTIDAHRAA
jgi:Protein of unknown function (DUF3102)